MCDNNELLRENLFNNRMVQEARRNMTPEQIKNYERIGREIHSISFDKENYSNTESLVEKSYAKTLIEYMKSGLTYEDFNEKERNIIKKYQEEGLERHNESFVV